ncbi:MAG: hypothetical protein RL660_2963 [Bacteroidota bacterium]|jgi:thiol-disulfide isomerase/thioredoxin
MKKILLTLTALLSFAVSQAQTAFSENFNTTAGTAMPTGWMQYNVDGLTVSTSLSATLQTAFNANGWITRGTTDRYATSCSWFTTVATANDWMVTPQINIPTTGYWLVFLAASQDAQYMDSLKIYTSTTGNAVANFTSAPIFNKQIENGWAYYAVNMSAYAGQNVYIAFVNQSTDKFLLNIDEVEVKVLPNKDAGIVAFGPTSESRAAFTQVNGAGISFNGTIFNYGATPITSLDLKWSDGGAPNNYTLSGINVAPYQMQTFTHNVPATFSSVANKSIKFWTALAGDANMTNDSAKTDIGSYQDKPSYKITFEEGTGTWCGWCPRGAVYMDSMEKNYGNSTTLIAVHNGDPMTVSVYDAGMGTLIGGYPSSMANREDEIDPSQMPAYYLQHKDDFGYGAVALTGTLSGSSLSCTGSFTPSVNLKGNYRMAFVITEDNVTGTGTTWNQANYYSNSQDLIYNGVNWRNLPNPVLAANMKYDHVATYIADGFTGTPNSLPAPMSAGTPYTKAFTYTLPNASRAWVTHAHLLIVNTDNGAVANSNSMSLVTNIASEMKEVDGMTFYPNPASTVVNFNITALEGTDAQFAITNSMGQTVKASSIKLAQGTNEQTLDISNLAAGTYNVTLTTKSGRVTAPLSVVR